MRKITRGKGEKVKISKKCLTKGLNDNIISYVARRSIPLLTLTNGEKVRK